MTSPSTGQRVAVIYARVSTEEQGKGFSIPTQIEACQTLARRDGYSVPEHYVLIDEGISGTTLARPGLRKLRELVHAKAISAVIVHDPDRLSRNLGHQLLMAEEWEQAAVQLLIVSHPLEHGPEGWLFFQMRGALAEYERAKTLERTKRGLLGRAKAGHAYGASVPFGYRYISEPHRGRFEIDGEEASVVRRIFDLCLAGQSSWVIARQLTAEGVPTKWDRSLDTRRSKSRKTWGEWNYDTVYSILTNEAYIGRVFWNKRRRVSKTRTIPRPREEWIEIPVPPIIDTATFQAVQTALPQHKVMAARNRKYTYLLVGRRLRCGRCGRTMSGAFNKGVRRYRCNSLGMTPSTGKWCGGTIRADVVEPQVWAAVVQALEHPELIAAEVARQEAHADERRAEVRQELALIEAALTKCDREAQRWADAYAGEVITLAELKGYRAEIETRRQSLLTEYRQGHARLESIGHVVGQAGALIEYCARVRQRLQTFDDAEKRVALEALAIRVTWIPEQPLVIEGSIPVGAIVSNTPGCTRQRAARVCIPGPGSSLLVDGNRGR
jgi:site-specific DNA recombinase